MKNQTNYNHVFIYIYPADSSVPSQERIRNCAHDYTQKLQISQAYLTDFQISDHGKPYFSKRPDLHFSISHSGEFWICALARSPIGADIERRKDRNQQGIAARFFHSNEYKYLEQTEFADFHSVWTAKESYVKYTGIGITDAFSDFSVITDKGIFGGCMDGEIFCFIAVHPQYDMCVYTFQPQSITTIWK